MKRGTNDGTSSPWSNTDIAVFLRGDNHVARRFLRDFGPALARQIARYCPWQIRHQGRAAAKEWVNDNLQGLLVTLLESDKLQRFDPTRAPLIGYLRMLAARHVLSGLRRTRRALCLTAPWADPGIATAAPPQDRLEEHQLCHRLVAALQRRLSADLFQTFQMLFLEDVDGSMKDLAAQVQLSSATLYKRKERIHEELRAAAAEILRHHR